MCGICGVTGEVDEAVIRRMTSSMIHRGPDDEGVFTSPRLSMGMRRLKIIDLEGGHQPISNETERVWIVYNGEVYNFQELRREMEEKGHSFRTGTDTETIVHLYEEFGDTCVNHLRGMFAFALWDSDKGRLLLARDRVGVKPLYYAVHGGKLVFASEVGPILSYMGGVPELNPTAIDDFFTFLYNPSFESVFSGIRKVPPGSILTWEEGRMEIHPYWDIPTPSTGGATSMDHLLKEVRRLLQDAVTCRMISDVPLGAFLSGGIDSSAVVAFMAASSSEPVKTFSLGFDRCDDSFNELEYARMVSRHFHTEHEEFIVKPELTELIADLVKRLDEPMADSSAIPTYIVSKLARKKVTVALTGIGGDELFGGYPRYIGMRLSGIYDLVPSFLHRNLAVRLAGTMHPTYGSGNLQSRVLRFLGGWRLPPADKYVGYVSFVRSRERELLYTERFRGELEKIGAEMIHQRAFNSLESGDIYDRMFRTDVKTYLPDDLLFMGDRMSMANSLELRVPLCDHQLLEFAARVPGSVRMKRLRLKYLLKRSLSGILPNEILTRRKQGFMIPLARWLKEEMRDLVFEILSRREIEGRGILSYPFLERAIEEHMNGKRDNAPLIWSALVFELWFRHHVEGRDI